MTGEEALGGVSKSFQFLLDSQADQFVGGVSLALDIIAQVSGLLLFLPLLGALPLCLEGICGNDNQLAVMRLNHGSCPVLHAVAEFLLLTDGM